MLAKMWKFIRMLFGYFDEPEYCIICHAKTEYMRSTHIDARVGYVEGMGQLCRGCDTHFMHEPGKTRFHLIT